MHNKFFFNIKKNVEKILYKKNLLSKLSLEKI